MISKFNYLLFVLFLFVFAKIEAQILETENQYGLKHYSKSNLLFDERLLFLSELEILNLLKKYPESISKDKALILQADIDAKYGNYILADGRLKEFIDIRANSPFVPFAAFKRGVMNFENKKYDFAIENFKFAKESALKQKYLRNDSAYKTLAHISTYWQAVSTVLNGSFNNSVAVFDECRNIDKNGTFVDESYFALGQAASKDGKHKQAIKYFRKIRTDYPYSNSYLQSLIKEANTSLIVRDYSSALVALERAQRIYESINKQDSLGSLFEEQSNFLISQEHILYLRGEANNLGKNYEDALIYFNSFLGTFLSSKLANHVRLGAGWSLLNLKRYDEAIKLYDYIIKNTNEEQWRAKSTAQLYRVVALKLSGKIEQAKKEMTALSVQSGFPFIGEVLLELGQIYYEEKNFELARKTLVRADRESIDAVNTTRIFLLLGATYLEIGMWKKAVEVYDRALEIAENSLIIYMPKKEWYIREAIYKKGVASIKSGNSIAAIKDLSAFISKEPNENRKKEAMFWLAEAYYRADRFLNAINVYESLLEQYPRTNRREEALYGLGWAYFITQKFTNSAKIFDKMVDEYPQSKFAIEVVGRLGDAAFMRKDYNKAIKFYDKAIKMSPNSEEGIYCSFQRTQCLWKSNRINEAEIALFQFVTKYRKSKFAPFTMYTLGWLKFQQKKYKESVDNLKFLLEQFPNSAILAKTNFTIADAYYNMGDYENAAEFYQTVIRKFPTSALATESLDALRICYINLGRPTDAIEIVDTYKSENPNSPFTPLFMGSKAQDFLDQGLYKDAIKEYNDLIDKYPKHKKNDEAMYWIGKSYDIMDNTEDAITAYKKLQTTHPNSSFTPLAMIANALLHKRIAKPLIADSIFKSIEVLYPKSAEAPEAGFQRAALKYNMSDSLGAIEQWKNTANTYGENTYALNSRLKVAIYYRRNEKNDSARLAYEKLTHIKEEINKGYAAEAQYRIGELWLKDKENDLAIEAFIKVKENYPDYEDWFTLSLLKLGELYENDKRWEDANEMYRIVVELRQDDDYGKTAARRLKRVSKFLKD